MECLEKRLAHFDASGAAIMADVSDKRETKRAAVARGRIRMAKNTMEAIRSGTVQKGDVLGVARVAGIMAVKRTPDLIPLCHPLLITKCSLDFHLDREACQVEAVCTVGLTGKTGVEMEALTGVSVALLTIYDMCKALDQSMEISGVCLAEKTGGKSGAYRRRDWE